MIGAMAQTKACSLGFVPAVALRPSGKQTSVSQKPSRRRVFVPCAAMRRALVAGANRGLGLSLTQALSSMGLESLVGTRRASSSGDALSALDGVDDMELDIRDRDAVIASVRALQPDVLFSCIGGTVDDDDRPDYVGNQNLIDAAEEGGVKRFVLVSALGAGNSEASVPFQVMDTMRPLLLDKSRAELYLRESTLGYTIVRACPLVDGPANGGGMVTEGTSCYGTISRNDLASLLVRVGTAQSAASKTLTAIDRTRVLLTSPYVRPLEFWEPLPVEEFDVGG